MNRRSAFPAVSADRNKTFFAGLPGEDLVVVESNPASLDVRLEAQSARYDLVVV